MPACSGATSPATAPTPASVHREIERVLADAAWGLEQRDLERARALAKAGMMMSLESCWGQASYLATRLLRDGELVEPAEIVARLDARHA